MVDQLGYLGLCLAHDPKLLVHRAVSAIIGKSKKVHDCVAAVTYSLWYGQHHYKPDTASAPSEILTASAPSEILTLWKSTVMPHFALYLWYLPLDTQLKTFQRELNSSLRRTLRVYGRDLAF